MNGENFNAVAADFPEPFRLFLRETVESTNDEVRQLAQSGAADGVIVIAERQTAGRGRRGAAWYSPPSESLTFSILARPSEPKSLWPRLALAAGLALAEALESCGVEAGIKWPNDVWIRGKKAAGILVEAGSDFVVVGIGLNINSIHFPPEVAEIATSMRIESGREFKRPEILGKIIRKFAQRRIQIGQDFEELISAVSLRCILTGKQISLHTAAGPRVGKMVGIAPGGELLLQGDDGIERIIQADEVRLLTG